MRKPRPQGHVRVRLLQLTRGGEWWRSFCSLAGGGECGCSYYGNVARGGDEGRRFCSIHTIEQGQLATCVQQQHIVAASVGGASVAWPLAARAQQSERMRRVAILPYTERDAEIRTRIATFRQQLRKLGWAEGDNLRTEERWSGDDMDRVRRYVAELVNLNPDVILVAGRRVVPIVQQQTRSIPVVFVGISDRVASGLVATLARPGGNLGRQSHRVLAD